MSFSVNLGDIVESTIPSITRTRVAVRLAALLGIALSSTAIAASVPHGTEIRVSLFGQPCLLQGPMDEATLKNIHSISPEQAYPPISVTVSSEQIKKTIEKLKGISGLPSALDRYRERVIRRLDGQRALYEGFDSARKSRQGAGLIKVTKPFIRPIQQKAFEALAAKLDNPALTPPQRNEVYEQLLDAYNESMIEPDPEEDFHRAIKKLGVQYVCAFEESGEVNAE